VAELREEYKVVKEHMDSILQFSGLERFRDAKLKNLSSGMQMRLGFSVAIELKNNRITQQFNIAPKC
jgi:ABC-type polysaccharide/polyol phosphate transport system ATPase subunit